MRQAFRTTSLRQRDNLELPDKQTYAFGNWEKSETVVPIKNPQRYGNMMKTPHSTFPG